MQTKIQKHGVGRGLVLDLPEHLQNYRSRPILKSCKVLGFESSEQNERFLSSAQNERFFICSSEKESEPLVTLVRPQKAASFTPSQRVSQTRGIYIWSQPSVAQSGVPYTYFQTVLNCFTIVLPPTPLVHSERTELCLDCTTHSTQCSTHSQQYILQ